MVNNNLLLRIYCENIVTITFFLIFKIFLSYSNSQFLLVAKDKKGWTNQNYCR